MNTKTQYFTPTRMESGKHFTLEARLAIRQGEKVILEFHSGLRAGGILRVARTMTSLPEQPPHPHNLASGVASHPESCQG